MLGWWGPGRRPPGVLEAVLRAPAVTQSHVLCGIQSPAGPAWEDVIQEGSSGPVLWIRLQDLRGPSLQPASLPRAPPQAREHSSLLQYRYVVPSREHWMPTSTWPVFVTTSAGSSITQLASASRPPSLDPSLSANMQLHSSEHHWLRAVVCGGLEPKVKVNRGSTAM